MTCPRCHCPECKAAATAELNRVLRKHIEHHIGPIKTNSEPDPDALRCAMTRTRPIIAGAAAMASLVGAWVDEYQHDAKIVIKPPPKVPDIEIELSRKDRRAFGAKKLRLKGLRP